MITVKSADTEDPWVAIATKSGRRPALQLVEYAALRSHLGHLPDAGEVAVWMAEKVQGDDKRDPLLRRIEALEAERLDREKAQIDEARRENKRLMEAANVTG